MKYKVFQVYEYTVEVPEPKVNQKEKAADDVLRPLSAHELGTAHPSLKEIPMDILGKIVFCSTIGSAIGSAVALIGLMLHAYWYVIKASKLYILITFWVLVYIVFYIVWFTKIALTYVI